MTTHVRVDVADGVATITLDGPATRNAFSRATGQALGEAYAGCDVDDDVRVIVLTGAGSAFCSGADVSAGSGSFDAPDDVFSSSPVTPRAWDVPKLVVAAVNGHAIGIGLTIALQCDVRIVAADARLAVPQVRRGTVGDAQSHWSLRRIAGAGVAADLLLTGRTIRGEEAMTMGLATRCLPAHEVLPAALDLAREVAVHASPASVALSKATLWADLDRDATDVAENAAHRELMGHPDLVDAARAWRERRPPRWTRGAHDVGGES